MGEIEKQIDNLRIDIDNIKFEQERQGKEILVIKTQLTNHIPHTLEEHGNILKALESRLKPIETKDIKITGVSEFLTLILKAVAIFTAVAWSAIQILHYTHVIS
jgi:hypothetical protein